MLSRQEILGVLKELSELKVSIALCGGAALQFYGSWRLTANVDVLAEGPLPGYESGKRLFFGGYQTLVASVPVQVIIRNDDSRDYYEAARRAARPLQDSFIPIVSPEFMALLKLDTRRRLDELDLEELMLSGHVDFAKCRKLFKLHLGLGAAHEFEHKWNEATFRRALDLHKAKHAEQSLRKAKRTPEKPKKDDEEKLG